MDYSDFKNGIKKIHFRNGVLELSAFLDHSSKIGATQIAIFKRAEDGDLVYFGCGFGKISTDYIGDLMENLSYTLGSITSKGEIDFKKAKNFIHMCDEVNGIGQKEQNWHNVKNI